MKKKWIYTTFNSSSAFLAGGGCPILRDNDLNKTEFTWLKDISFSGYFLNESLFNIFSLYSNVNIGPPIVVST